MNPTRKTDESFYRLFSASHTVSEHLTKREDSELRDKYDHNAFCYYSQPSADEVRAALAYQKERGDTFLKLEGYEPLVGDCYIFASDGYVCMDGLLVDEDFRHQYIAMTLMKHIAEKAQERGEILYLHADSEDTPKELYAKMGFQAVDKLYEYLCTDFSKLKI